MPIQLTYGYFPPRADLERNDFENLIYQKGRNVLYEKALQCPCKSGATNQQSNCKNCGGSGWTYINPKSTRMVLTGISVASESKPWSEESRGNVKVTCSDKEQLTFMDRLTVVDGSSIHQEVLFFKKEGDEYFAYSAYPMKSLIYAGKFISSLLPFQRLTTEVIFGDSNLIRLNPTAVTPPEGEDSDNQLAVTVRYHHAPVYYVLELSRETMQSFKVVNGQEENQNLPTSAVARRAHYVLNSPSLIGTRLVDNSYVEECDDCITSTTTLNQGIYGSCYHITYIGGSLGNVYGIPYNPTFS